MGMSNKMHSSSSPNRNPSSSLKFSSMMSKPNGTPKEITPLVASTPDNSNPYTSNNVSYNSNGGNNGYNTISKSNTSSKKDLASKKLSPSIKESLPRYIDEESFVMGDEHYTESENSSGFFPNLNSSCSAFVPRVPKEKTTVSLRQKLSYYFPCGNWLSEYKSSYFFYDIIAGLTLASYQIPLSISFATAVAHVPTSSGLLGLSIGPIVYTFMGTVPQMIIGPEAAVSMIIGQNVEKITKHNPHVDPVDILCNLTFLSGSILLVFGLLRFGYLDNVLCGTLLRGFITAIGLSMMLNSLISILGLNSILQNLPSDFHVHSVLEKFYFLVRYCRQYHKPSAIIGFTAFFILLLLSHLKKVFVKRKFKKASYFPEILVTIVVFTYFSYLFDFSSMDIDIVGKVTLDGFKLRNPLSESNRSLWPDLFPVSFVCAILGFFETSTAAKSLSSNLEMPVSSNRELVSLGVVGTTVTWFGALPSFGGYARSKLNALIGAKTPFSGCVMGLTTLFITFNCLNYIYYLPLSVLNAVTLTVGYGMIKESPKELKFHFRTRGWNEIITFFVTLSASLYYSVEVGVLMGSFYSLMRVLKHSTQSRVQILSRVAGTDTFINPDFDNSTSKNFFNFPNRVIVPGYKEFRKQSIIDDGKNLAQTLLSEIHESTVPSDSSPVSPTSENAQETHTVDVFPQLEDREGCLIVKVAEPLTFFNANDMKGRLKRIELYGSAHEHPGSDKTHCNKELRHVVFDMHGMTSIDSSATQILYEIIDNYQKRGINIFLTRLFKNKNLIERLRDSGIELLLSILDGEEFGIKQIVRPYYDDILDALKAIDKIDSSCEWETRSYFSTSGFDQA